MQLAREGSLSYRSLLLLTSAGVWSYAVGGRAPQMETALLEISFIHSTTCERRLPQLPRRRRHAAVARTLALRGNGPQCVSPAPRYRRWGPPNRRAHGNDEPRRQLLSLPLSARAFVRRPPPTPSTSELLHAAPRRPAPEFDWGAALPSGRPPPPPRLGQTFFLLQAYSSMPPAPALAAPPPPSRCGAPPPPPPRCASGWASTGTRRRRWWRRTGARSGARAVECGVS